MPETNQSNRYLRFPEVQHRAGGMSRTTIWRREREGSFPRSHRISKGISAWLERDIEQWIAERAEAGR